MFPRAFQYSLSRANVRIYRFALVTSFFLFSLLLLGGYLFANDSPALASLRFNHAAALKARSEIIASAQDFIEHGLGPTAFGAMGRRTENLTQWFESASLLKRDLTRGEYAELSSTLDQALTSTYPFLQSSNSDNPQPALAELTARFKPGSRGIVITAGKGHLRFAMHLIANIRHVLKSSLPVQVVYAGEEDLPQNYRDLLTSSFDDVETLDILTVFNHPSLELEHGGWAVKPFAMLASKFAHTILVDADSIFLQKPEVMLDSHTGYLERGALMFHDRLLWQNVFKARAKWWRQELGDRPPSDSLLKSKVWTEGYAEEVDSGVIVLDKGRLPVLMGLLHICWQNTAAVREEVTYKVTYGDKESYWFGLELCGVPFVFEEHYGSIVGELKNKGGVESVCSFTIAHVDEQLKLLWYNGSLLRAKLRNQTEFMVPDVWMTDGKWVRGPTKEDLSCMENTEVRRLEEDERRILAESVEAAKAVDADADARGFNLTLDSAPAS